MKDSKHKLDSSGPKWWVQVSFLFSQQETEFIVIQSENRNEFFEYSFVQPYLSVSAFHSEVAKWNGFLRAIGTKIFAHTSAHTYGSSQRV